MSVQPLALYADGLRAAKSGESQHLTLRYADGSHTLLDVGRWVRPSDAVDESLLCRVSGAVLDVGCGPGRLVETLTSRGVRVLGIDIAVDAVAMTLQRGALALCRSVFDRVPAAGRWGTALLVDGNIGIGGEPPALFRRIRELLAPDGRLLLEAAAPSTDSLRSLVRIESEAARSSWFPWARVCISDVSAIAASTSFAVSDVWTQEGRWFAELRAL